MAAPALWASRAGSSDLVSGKHGAISTSCTSRPSRDFIFLVKPAISFLERSLHLAARHPRQGVSSLRSA